MKKIISLILVTVILSFSLVSCAEKTEPPVEEEKAKSVYIDWFGVTIDLKQLLIQQNPNLMWNGNIPTFEEKLKRIEKRGLSYVVVRAECTGNWIQRVYKDFEDSMNHTEEDNRFYIEIPFEILEVLEGDASIIQNVPYKLKVEYPRLYAYPSYITPDSPQSKYKPPRFDLPSHSDFSHEFLSARIGFEYVLVLHRNEKTGCIYSSSSVVECELSSLSDQRDYYYTSREYHEDSRQPDTFCPANYYEILERYNIKVD